MKIAKGTHTDKPSIPKVLSSADYDLLVTSISIELKIILGNDDCAEFDPKELQAYFLVDQRWACDMHTNGYDFERAYNQAVAELTEDIVDVPAEVDEETGKVITPAVTHKDYQIAETFYATQV